MNEKELEKTKPINILSDISNSREEKYSNIETLEEEDSREERYRNSILESERAMSEEAAEEALAEKNIALAENYLSEEQAHKTAQSSEPKRALIDKIKDKWSNLEKKQKIMVIVIALLLLILLIIFLIFLFKDKKVEEKPKENPPVVDVAPTITDNFYYKEGKLYFLNESEEELGSYECDNKDSNLCYVAYNNYRDGFDVPKLETVDGKEKIGRMPIFDNKYVFIVDNKEAKDTSVKLYSIADSKVTDTYKTAAAYDDNYIIVSDTIGKYGLLEITDTVDVIIKPEYESLRMIDKEDNLVAKNKKGIFIINKKNKVISSTFDSKSEIRNYNNNFVVAKISGTYNVYDYKANLLASGYDFITIADNYAALVDSEGKVYIIDNEKNKYNEGNIKLNTTDYVKTFVYDDKGASKEIKRSFELTVKENSIEVSVYRKNSDEPKYFTVELVEGKINKKFKYINYFDSKLYFYKDEEKTELLGSYTCDNKNYVTKETDTYEYCFPAKDAIYEDNDMTNNKRTTMTPLINDKYVFITDGTNTVKLYNLDSNKVQGTYTSVDTNIKSNNNEFNRFTGRLDVIALNKKGKYGLLKFEGTSLNAVHGFDYNHLEKLGDFILAQDGDNKWKILYDEERVSGTVTGKIRGYNSTHKYLKVKSGNVYSVFTEGGEITSDATYQYVELYDDYYAGVTDKKEIYIYDYQGNKLTNTPVNVSSTDYTNFDNKAFKVEKQGKNFNVSVFDGSKYTIYTVAEETKEPTPLPPSPTEED